MTAILGVLAFAVLFGGFAFMAPVLRRKACSGGSCGACGSTSCKKLERET